MVMVVLGEFYIECMKMLIKITETGEEELYIWSIMDIETIITCISYFLIRLVILITIKHQTLTSPIIDGISQPVKLTI